MSHTTDRLYNDQCNEVDFYYDHDRAMFDVLDKEALNMVLLYFGVGKYESEENFLKRRKRIVQVSPGLEKQAIIAMRKVLVDSKNDASLFLLSTR